MFAATRAKIARRHIAGAMRVIDEHLSRIRDYSGNPGDPGFKSLFDHIKKHLGNIKKAANRLRGSQQEETLQYVDDMMKQLEEMAREHGLPWNN